MVQLLFRRWFHRLPPVSIPPTQQSQAEAGSADAQFHLGFQYANGEGVVQSYEAAAKWYLKAAEQNHALAEFNLGVMHAGGHGVAQDDPASQRWFTKSAGHG